MITFISTAYKETIDSYIFLSSLLLQTDNNWKCIIMCDTKNEYIDQTVKFFNDPRISIYHSQVNTGYWGHYNRKKALYDLVTTEWVIQTSIQDYFTPNTLSEIYKYTNNFDFIYYDSIHNHFDYNVLVTSLKSCNIDWGNFALKTNIARQIGINHIESNICDGLFVEECIKYPNLKIHKINKILTIHN
jgi:hypothetical protein